MQSLDNVPQSSSLTKSFKSSAPNPRNETVRMGHSEKCRAPREPHTFWSRFRHSPNKGKKINVPPSPGTSISANSEKTVPGAFKNAHATDPPPTPTPPVPRRHLRHPLLLRRRQRRVCEWRRGRPAQPPPLVVDLLRRGRGAWPAHHRVEMERA